MTFYDKNDAYNEIEKVILAAGFEKIHTSKSGSRYYERYGVKTEGETLRLSDHDIPTADGMGIVNRWTHEIIVKGNQFVGIDEMQYCFPVADSDGIEGEGFEAYEDYQISELLPAIEKHLPAAVNFGV